MLKSRLKTRQREIVCTVLNLSHKGWEPILTRDLHSFCRSRRPRSSRCQECHTRCSTVWQLSSIYSPLPFEPSNAVKMVNTWVYFFNNDYIYLGWPKGLETMSLIFGLIISHFWSSEKLEWERFVLWYEAIPHLFSLSVCVPILFRFVRLSLSNTVAIQELILGTLANYSTCFLFRHRALQQDSIGKYSRVTLLGVTN